MSYRISVTGDIHLLHPRTPTLTIAHNLYGILEELIPRSDILFINGDLFDAIVTMASSDYHVIQKFMYDLATLCVTHNTKFRLLEGTSSHDLAQGRGYQDEFKALGVGLDFKYVDDISIEYFPDLDIHVGYIPDEMGKPEAVLHTLKERMEALGIQQLDTLMMHGNFKYQLPIELEAYEESDFMPLVKDYILISHIHTHSKFGNIIAPGSPDRLKFGEEEDKGVVFVRKEDGVLDYTFIKNKKAVTYDTIKTDDIGYIKKRIQATNGNLRIITNCNPSQFKAKRGLRVVFDTPKEKVVVKKTNDEPITSFTIDKGNIKTLLMEGLPVEVDRTIAGDIIDDIRKKVKT